MSDHIASSEADDCYERLCTVANTQEHFPWVVAFGQKPTRKRISRVGKWLLFPDCESAVGDWEIVASETAKGTIWQSKISLLNSSNTEGGHLICVYTQDFCDVEDVRAIAIRLWQLDLKVFQKRREMYYKPDEFTEEEIYTEGQPSSIFALRSGSTFIRKTAGFSNLERKLQLKIEKAMFSLPVLPRINSRSRRKQA